MTSLRPGSASALRPRLQGSLPPCAGIGMRVQHMAEIRRMKPAIGWLEIHSENFLAEGGPRQELLAEIALDYPISAHGVGLSLANGSGLDAEHLTRLRRLMDWLQPAMISDHLAWAGRHDDYLNDLLPIPYTPGTLAVVAANLDRAQQALGRRILVENPSTYLTFADSTLTEWDFLAGLAERTGCGLLLDVNNIYVSAHNHGFEAEQYLRALPDTAIAELHVAGHTRAQIGGRDLLIDDHGSPVIDPVWDLLAVTLDRIGPRPVLVEWDLALPPLGTLLAEAVKADRVLALQVDVGRRRVAVRG